MTADKEPKAREARVLPMDLELGDLLVDERGLWRVVGRPYTTAAGKIARVRVELVGQPHIRAIRMWNAHKRVVVRRGQSYGMTPLQRGSVITMLVLLTWAVTADAKGAWVLWRHSYEVWVDGSKADHRRDVAWKKVAATAAKSDCEQRGVSEARAEYHTLTGKGIRATLSGSKVGFHQPHKRFTHGYRNFECWPDTVDPRGPKTK
jgi:hypothetical protein